MLFTTVVLLAVLVGAYAFFAGSETALMSLNRYRLRHLEGKKRAAALVKEALTHPERVLGTILTCNLFVSNAAVALTTYVVTIMVADTARSELSITIATVVLTAVILVFGDMVPKSYAARHPEGWSFVAIRVILFFVKLLRPIVRLLTFVSESVLRLLGQKLDPQRHEITLEEIKAVVYAGETGAVEGRKGRMLRRVLELSERRVSEVMVPRTAIVAIEIGASFEDVLEVVRRERYSRMPVYRETLDHVEGIIYAKDIIASWNANVPFRLSQWLRRAYFIPDGSRVEQTLDELQKHRVHLALVVDEHGGVEGLVTLEDLIEEIVGEIEDELDEESNQVKLLADGSYSLDASVSVKDLNAKMGWELPELPEYNTLAGLILSRLGRIPIQGEEVEVAGLVLRIDKIAGRRIVRVLSRQARTVVEPSVAQSSTSPKKK